jgi:hypothetical protein
VTEDAGDARLIQVRFYPHDMIWYEGSWLNAYPASLQSLYRDLAMLTAGYLIEGKQKTGKPRTSVPKQLAVPFETAAALVGKYQDGGLWFWCMM